MVPVRSNNQECYHCGGAHAAVKCFKKDWKCYICKKKGHLANKCRYRTPRKEIKNIEDEQTGTSSFQSKEGVQQQPNEEIILGNIMTGSELDPTAQVPL